MTLKKAVMLVVLLCFATAITPFANAFTGQKATFVKIAIQAGTTLNADNAVTAENTPTIAVKSTLNTMNHVANPVASNRNGVLSAKNAAKSPPTDTKNAAANNNNANPLRAPEVVTRNWVKQAQSAVRR